MNEKTLKAELVKEIRRNLAWEVIRHEDRFGAGVPDISITWPGRSFTYRSVNHNTPSKTAWIEVKVSPVRATGLQQERLRRLGGFLLVYGGKRHWQLFRRYSLVASGDGHQEVREFFQRYFNP